MANYLKEIRRNSRESRYGLCFSHRGEKHTDLVKVDADGDILDKHGNTVGKADRFQEEDESTPGEAEILDRSVLEGKKVNKAGNVVDANGKLIGRVVDGDISKLNGKKCDAEGKIWSDSGKVIGSADIIPTDERDESSDAPFADFPDAVVDSKGNVIFEGQCIGKLNEGDAKKLAGKKVDKDGEVVDKVGNVLGKAERWTEPDTPEPEVIDMSALAGKRVRTIFYYFSEYTLTHIVQGKQTWKHCGFKWSAFRTTSPGRCQEVIWKNV